MKTFKRITSLLLAAVLAFSLAASCFAGDTALTRQEAAEMLVQAADDYHRGVKTEDILKGYPDGNLDLSGTLTRAQALMMLDRAFGGLPAPVGDSARTAAGMQGFSDAPAWGGEELSRVLSSGIVAGEADGLLHPDAPVTREDLQTLISRVYALEGTNRKDDFYAAVNKTWLDSSDIPAGLSINGPFYGLSLTVTEQVAKLIADIAAKPQTPGTPEAKIKALYDSVMDVEAREQADVAPIQAYLDAMENAKTLSELIGVECRLQKELGLSTILGFGLTSDFSDSNRKVVAFSSFGASMTKDFYENGTQEQKDAFLAYLEKLLTLSGLSGQAAVEQAKLVYAAEAKVAKASYDPQEYSDVDKINNIYKRSEIQRQFPKINLEKVYEASGLALSDRILVTDPGAMQAAASYFNDAGLETLKALSRTALLMSIGGCLNQGFIEASVEFTKAYYGIDMSQTTEQIAAQQVQSLLADYLGRAYVEAHFSEKAKQDVEEMIHEFLDIYKARIEALDWMSDATKQKAIRKLDTMKIKVGYPDSWQTYLDDADIKSPSEGGTFFSNVISIQAAAKKQTLTEQNAPVDKTDWLMEPFTVNACYSATSNDITFPAAILQKPLYDVNASREENLGGIGYIIAHEITHAFDNNGAKFDENGNAANWWTAQDYAAFQQKCMQVASWYEGQEACPGVSCSGVLTISENVADLGAMQCILAAAKQKKNPNLDRLFRAVANTWASTTTRQMREYLATMDVHAPDKLRCNRVLQTIAEFYETYDIQPGDGMWTDPESRVTVW